MSDSSSRKKLVGRKIQITAYVTPEVYEALASFAPPGSERWESAVLKRIISEWLFANGEPHHEWEERYVMEFGTRTLVKDKNDREMTRPTQAEVKRGTARKSPKSKSSAEAKP